MSSTTTPRLIEQWMPINQISTEAIRERAGAVPNPAPHQLHVWWARRPLSLPRAATLLSLIPQSADSDETRQHVYETLGTSPDIHHIAERLATASKDGERDKEGYGKHRRAFTHNPTAPQVEWLNSRITLVDHTWDYTPHEPPTILDVTAGGGSIPFEAGRLGLRTIANELNPVACLILRATCQWPQQHGYALLDDYQECAERFLTRVNELLADLYPDEPVPDCANGQCPHPQGICNRAGCEHKTENCSQFVHARAASRAQRYAQTYLWAREAQCPSCHVQIPLSPNWRLDDKSTGMRLETHGAKIEMSIVHDRSDCSDCKASSKNCHLSALYPDQAASDGTVTRAIASCPACGSTTPKGYLAQEAQAGRMGHRLYCVIYRDSWRDLTKAGKPKKRETTCRIFAEPQGRHLVSDTQVAQVLDQLEPQWDANDILPSEALPEGNKTKDAIYYGMEHWREMFNPRQQLAHGYCVQAFQECVDTDEDVGRLSECRKAAWSYVAIALDKMINRNSLHSIWVAQTSTVGQTFSTHDLGFKWSYAEMIVGGPHGYGLRWAIDDVHDCLTEMLAMTGHAKNNSQSISHAVSSPVAPPTEIIQGDARNLPLENASVDCVVFDSPYEENVNYAELSDFFYVWLKRTAGYVFPDDFTDYLTEKDQEAISSPARFRHRATKGKSAKTLALAEYREKMTEIFAECRRVVKDDGITTVMFNHKSSAAWDSLTVALIEAGFAITRTWPVKTEAESSMHIKGKAAARTTILLVCRPREENPYPKPWHEVEELIAQAVTERESANPDRPEAPFAVTPTDALQVARREVSRHRAQQISNDWANNPVDAATKFYILAKDATENDTLMFDEANLLARAIGVTLEKNDAAMKSIVSFKADKVTLLSARDWMAARQIGEDIKASTTLDAVQTAVALTDRRNTLDAQEWLTNRLHDPQDSGFRSTLEALIRTSKPGHDDIQAQRSLWQTLYGIEPPQPPVQMTLSI